MEVPPPGLEAPVDAETATVAVADEIVCWWRAAAQKLADFVDAVGGDDEAIP